MSFFLVVRFDSFLVLFAKYNRRLTCPLINQINEFIPWKNTYQQAIHKVSKAAKSYLKKKITGYSETLWNVPYQKNFWHFMH